MHKIPPPFIMAFGILLEWALHKQLPFATFHSLQFIGYLLILLALVPGFTSTTLFAKNKTQIIPHKKPIKMVTSWPYNITRNPMYLGLEVMLIGFAAYFGSISCFIIPILFPILITKVFIEMEEKNMKKVFGKDYEKYLSSVRQWI